MEQIVAVKRSILFLQESKNFWFATNEDDCEYLGLFKLGPIFLCVSNGTKQEEVVYLSVADLSTSGTFGNVSGGVFGIESR